MTDVGSNYRYCAPGSVERAIYIPCEFAFRWRKRERERLSTLAMLLMHKIIAILLHEKIYDIEFLRLRHPSLFSFPPLAYEQYAAVQASVIAHACARYVCVLRVYTSATFLM